MIEYTVSFDNIANANAFETALTYDESVMELVSVESLLGNTVYTDAKTENGVSDFILGVQNPMEMTEKTDVVKYVFRLKEGVKAESVTVELTKADTVDVLTGDIGTTSEDVKAFIVNGQVNTVIYSYEAASDINNDGTVTLADLSVAVAYYQTAESNCDINLDGVVNTLDYVIITSFMAR